MSTRLGVIALCGGLALALAACGGDDAGSGGGDVEVCEAVMRDRVAELEQRIEDRADYGLILEGEFPECEDLSGEELEQVAERVMPEFFEG